MMKYEIWDGRISQYAYQWSEQSEIKVIGMMVSERVYTNGKAEYFKLYFPT